MLRRPAFVVLLFALAAGGAFLALRGDDPPSYSPLNLEDDPWAYAPEREDDFERRAAAGHSHVVYVKSPGGIVATAQRVERYRDQIEEAAGEAGVDPDLIEGMVLLESAGRPDARASDDVESAAGLTQILAETATSLLGMRVDVERSERLTRKLGRARGPAEAARLRAQRARVDERFDPDKALAATGRYLQQAMDEFGREDLAVVSYHMGIGNLQGVIGAFGEEQPSYAELYFDSTPNHHVAAQQRLAAFGDDSSNYLWKLHAAREIMRLYREDGETLAATESLQTAKNSAEEVLHPPAASERFASPDALRAAWDDEAIRALPDDPALTGLARDRSMGELAGVLGAPPGLYRGLRPEALAVALYVGAQVREYAGGQGPLVVTSTVRDVEYQRLLVRRNREATRNYSLHTTGWSFDIARSYRSDRHARAFQFVLDRLQVLNVIAWVREPGAIHVTAAADVDGLLPLLERLD